MASFVDRDQWREKVEDETKEYIKGILEEISPNPDFIEIDCILPTTEEIVRSAYTCAQDFQTLNDVPRAEDVPEWVIYGWASPQSEQPTLSYPEFPDGNIGQSDNILTNRENRAYLVSIYLCFYTKLKELLAQRDESHIIQTLNEEGFPIQFNMIFEDFLQAIIDKILITANMWALTISGPLQWETAASARRSRSPSVRRSPSPFRSPSIRRSRSPLPSSSRSPSIRRSPGADGKESDSELNQMLNNLSPDSLISESGMSTPTYEPITIEQQDQFSNIESLEEAYLDSKYGKIKSPPPYSPGGSSQSSESSPYLPLPRVMSPSVYRSPSVPVSPVERLEAYLDSTYGRIRTPPAFSSASSGSSENILDLSQPPVRSGSRSPPGRNGRKSGEEY